MRETHPPWQFADSLETCKDRRAEGARRREGKGESRKPPRPKPRHSELLKARPWAWGGGRTPNHGGPLAQPMGPVGGEGALGPEDAEPAPPSGLVRDLPPPPLPETQLLLAKDLRQGRWKVKSDPQV